MEIFALALLVAEINILNLQLMEDLFLHAFFSNNDMRSSVFHFVFALKSAMS